VLQRKQASSSAELATPPSPPAGSGKREAILAAARTVFLEHGFAGASMDVITRRAGVSKATVYAHFPSKLELFEAIVRERCEATLAAAVAMAPGAAAPPLRDALRDLGRRFLGMLTDRGPLALWRVVVAEAARNPELGKAVYAAGPNRGATELAERLAAERAAGRLAIADPRLAAEQFFSMLLGHFHLRRLLAVDSAPLAAAEIDRAVDQAVAIFLDGARPR
jgi:AcrR family transcriptional regulator